MSEAKASKGPKKHDPTCYQLRRDIVIPAGSILRSDGKGEFGIEVGVEGLPRQSVSLRLHAPVDIVQSGTFRKVIAG